MDFLGFAKKVDFLKCAKKWTFWAALVVVDDDDAAADDDDDVDVDVHADGCALKSGLLGGALKSGLFGVR